VADSLGLAAVDNHPLPSLAVAGNLRSAAVGNHPLVSPAVADNPISKPEIFYCKTKCSHRFLVGAFSFYPPKNNRGAVKAVYLNICILDPGFG
jgi:hypothetical protein